MEVLCMTFYQRMHVTSSWLLANIPPSHWLLLNQPVVSSRCSIDWYLTDRLTGPAEEGRPRVRVKTTLCWSIHNSSRESGLHTHTLLCLRLCFERKKMNQNKHHQSPSSLCISEPDLAHLGSCLPCHPAIWLAALQRWHSEEGSGGKRQAPRPTSGTEMCARIECGSGMSWWKAATGFHLHSALPWQDVFAQGNILLCDYTVCIHIDFLPHHHPLWGNVNNARRSPIARCSFACLPLSGTHSYLTCNFLWRRFCFCTAPSCISIHQQCSLERMKATPAAPWILQIESFKVWESVVESTLNIGITPLVETKNK